MTVYTLDTRYTNDYVNPPTWGERLPCLNRFCRHIKTYALIGMSWCPEHQYRSLLREQYPSKPGVLYTTTYEDSRQYLKNDLLGAKGVFLTSLLSRQESAS